MVTRCLAWRNYAAEAPDESTPEIGLWSIAPLPELPEDLHGEPVVFVASLFCGPADEADPVLAPLRQLGTPLVDLSATVPYVEAQSALDELFPGGGRYYRKSHFLDELSDAAIATVLDRAAVRPTPESVIYLRTLGGAIASTGAQSARPADTAEVLPSTEPERAAGPPRLSAITSGGPRRRG